MPVSAQRHVVAETPVVIADGRQASNYLITNSGTTAVWLGGVNVTDQDGYTLSPRQALPVTMTGRDKLYAVAGADPDSSTVEVLSS